MTVSPSLSTSPATAPVASDNGTVMRSPTRIIGSDTARGHGVLRHARRGRLRGDLRDDRRGGIERDVAEGGDARERAGLAGDASADRILKASV